MGTGGARTANLYFDKGQSIHFNNEGIPDSGNGKFRLEATKPEGQLMAGWLSAVGSPNDGKKVKSVNVEFVPTDKEGFNLQLSDLLLASDVTNQQEGKKAKATQGAPSENGASTLLAVATPPSAGETSFVSLPGGRKLEMVELPGGVFGWGPQRTSLGGVIMKRGIM